MADITQLVRVSDCCFESHWFKSRTQHQSSLFDWPRIPAAQRLPPPNAPTPPAPGGEPPVAPPAPVAPAENPVDPVENPPVPAPPGLVPPAPGENPVNPEPQDPVPDEAPPAIPNAPDPNQPAQLNAASQNRLYDFNLESLS